MNRTIYGYPADIALQQAKKIAEQARSRNKPICDCQTCRELEMLPKVQRIVANWK